MNCRIASDQRGNRESSRIFTNLFEERAGELILEFLDGSICVEMGASVVNRDWFACDYFGANSLWNLPSRAGLDEMIGMVLQEFSWIAESFLSRTPRDWRKGAGEAPTDGEGERDE